MDYYACFVAEFERASVQLRALPRHLGSTQQESSSKGAREMCLMRVGSMCQGKAYCRMWTKLSRCGVVMSSRLGARGDIFPAALAHNVATCGAAPTVFPQPGSHGGTALGYTHKPWWRMA